jgi:hypothetical protein
VFSSSKISDDGKSPKTNNSECDTQSSEPFRIYYFNFLKIREIGLKEMRYNRKEEKRRKTRRKTRRKYRNKIKRTINKYTRQEMSTKQEITC